MKIKSILIVHSGRRDQYEVAYTFSKVYKTTLLTDFYYKNDSLFSKLVYFFYKKKVFLRQKKNLKCEISTSVIILLLDFISPIFSRFNFFYNLKSFFFSVKAKCLISENNYDLLFFYSNHGASRVFKKFNNKYKILFQMHPHPIYVRKLYNEFLLKRPQAKKYLIMEEEEMIASGEYFSNIVDESNLSDIVICTTSFTKKSLNYYEIDDSKIKVIPYGIESRSNSKNYKNNDYNSDFICLAFVGQFVIRKGIFDLLEAAKLNNRIKINFYTKDLKKANSFLQNEYAALNERVKVITIIDNKIMWEHASSNNDFLILPSIVEGFGMVILESLSYSLPIIVSKNTAGPDIIKHEVEGIILDNFYYSSILNSVNFLLKNKIKWNCMRNSAKKKSLQFNLQSFRSNLLKSI